MVEWSKTDESQEDSYEKRAKNSGDQDVALTLPLDGAKQGQDQKCELTDSHQHPSVLKAAYKVFKLAEHSASRVPARKYVEV